MRISDWSSDVCSSDLNPHIHILVRGVADDGIDLVIDRAYVSEGIRFRAEERVTLELGVRSAREMTQANDREIAAELWTSLGRKMARAVAARGGLRTPRPCTLRVQAAHQQLQRRVPSATSTRQRRT